MYFSLADAAKKVGISRSSIYRLIDEGKLSATLNQQGKKVVEITELLRVFGTVDRTKQQDKKYIPKKQGREAKPDTSEKLTSFTVELQQLRSQLQVKDMELKLKDHEISFTLERLEEVKQLAEKIQKEKEMLLQIVQSQTLLLEHRPIPNSFQAALPTATELAQPTSVKQVQKEAETTSKKVKGKTKATKPSKK